MECKIVKSSDFTVKLSSKRWRRRFEYIITLFIVILGFPGNLDVTMTFQLDDNNTFSIVYQATTDAPTIINFTNHSFFNLTGEGSPTVLDHLLEINANSYLPIDSGAIVLGKTENVKVL
jgi:galactose mutarotase-like enzyme